MATWERAHRAFRELGCDDHPGDPRGVTVPVPTGWATVLERRLGWLAGQLGDPDAPGRRVVALVGAGAVVAGVGFGAPSPSLRGPGLAVLLLLVAAVVAYLAVWIPRVRRHQVAALAALGTAGAALGGLAPQAALVFPFVAAFGAGYRMSPRAAAVLTTAIVVVFVTVGVGANQATGRLAWAAVGFVAVMLAGLNRATQQRVRAEQAQAAALDERARIAREIHDVLAHSLSGLSVQLEAAALLLSTGADPARVGEHLDRARGLTRTGLEETRRALRALRGDRLPVPDVLSELVASYRADTNAPAELQISGPARPLGAETSLCICRVAQEALTNIRRHASGAPVTVTLICPSDQSSSGEVALTVSNPTAGRFGITGSGGDTASAPPAGSGYGLIGMRERAELLGGALHAGPDGDGGWFVQLRIPA